jgi:hypothetical protein
MAANLVAIVCHNAEDLLTERIPGGLGPSPDLAEHGGHAEDPRAEPLTLLSSTQVLTSEDVVDQPSIA